MIMTIRMKWSIRMKMINENDNVNDTEKYSN